jgi:hypothetical protein
MKFMRITILTLLTAMTLGQEFLAYKGHGEGFFFTDEALVYIFPKKGLLRGWDTPTQNFETDFCKGERRRESETRYTLCDFRYEPGLIPIIKFTIGEGGQSIMINFQSGNITGMRTIQLDFEDFTTKTNTVYGVLNKTQVKVVYKYTMSLNSSHSIYPKSILVDTETDAVDVTYIWPHNVSKDTAGGLKTCKPLKPAYGVLGQECPLNISNLKGVDFNRIAGKKNATTTYLFNFGEDQGSFTVGNVGSSFNEKFKLLERLLGVEFNDIANLNKNTLIN